MFTVELATTALLSRIELRGYETDRIELEPGKLEFVAVKGTHALIQRADDDPNRVYEAIVALALAAGSILRSKSFQKRR